MSILQKAIELENQSRLAEAYEILKSQWKNGERDREIGLHLMFLSWYGIIEPEHLTGFAETDQEKTELNQTFNEVHKFFEAQIYDDAEILYVFGLAANMFWYMFENAEEWEKRAIKYQKRYRELEPNGIDPQIFDNRGTYGDYYTGQAEIEGGY
jgi:hypothetical protein